jgi:hypothetical protein
VDKESFCTLSGTILKRVRYYGIDGEIADTALKLGMKNYVLICLRDMKRSKKRW